MKKSGRLLSAFAAALVLLFVFSVCAQAAQIDSSDIRDGIFDVYVTGFSEENEINAKLYAVGKEADGVVSVVNSYLITDGKADGASDCLNGKIYVWEDATLAPLTLDYDLIDGRIYAAGDELCVPECRVVIVSELTDGILKGYEEGSETEYSLAEGFTVTGMSDNISNIKPGSVVSLLFDREGNVAVIELLTLLDGEGNDDDTLLKANCGEHAAADGSERYVNVIGVYYSAALNSMTVRFVGDEFENGDEEYKYAIESSAIKNVVHMSSDGTVASVEAGTDWSELGKIAGSNLVYAYLRYDTADNVVKEAVFYYFSEDVDVTENGDYSDVY